MWWIIELFKWLLFPFHVLLIWLFPKYKDLALGHKARVNYALWTVVILLALWIGVAGFDAEGAALLWFAGAWAGGLFLIYFAMTATEHISEHPKFRKNFRHGKGGSARWGGSGSLSKYEWKDD